MKEPVISVAVMTHPTRLRLARDVIGALEPLSPTLVVDPDPWGGPATLRTCLQCWQAVRPDATHHLVVQDDVLFADGFAGHLRDAVATYPDRPVAFFTEWASRNGMAVSLAAWCGARWTPGVPQYIPCHALVMSREQAVGFVAFARAWHDPKEPDDDVMRKYFATAGLRLMLAVPNIVEHRQFRSLIGNDASGWRSAACFAKRLPEGWLRGRGKALERLDELLFFRRARNEVYTRKDPDGHIVHAEGTTTMEWRKAAFEREAGRLGMDLAALSRFYNSYLEEQPESLVEQWFGAISPTGLWSLWLAGFLLGDSPRREPYASFAGKEKPDPAIIEILLANMVVGGLFPEAPHDRLSKYKTALLPILMAGISAAESRLPQT